MSNPSKTPLKAALPMNLLKALAVAVAGVPFKMELGPLLRWKTVIELTAFNRLSKLYSSSVQAGCSRSRHIATAPQLPIVTIKTLQLT
jgi:hypothetical protein